MNFNEESLVLEDLTDNEASDILEWCEDVVLKGQLKGQYSSEMPYFVKFWIDEFSKIKKQDHTMLFGLFEYNYMITISTIIPQRLLLSVIYNENKKFNQGYCNNIDHINIDDCQ